MLIVKKAGKPPAFLAAGGGPEHDTKALFSSAILFVNGIDFISCHIGGVSDGPTLSRKIQP